MTGRTIGNIMRVAQRFVDCNLSEQAESSKGYQKDIKWLSYVFWSVIGSIVRCESEKFSEVPEEDHRAFLISFQKLLRTNIGIPSRPSGPTHKELSGWIVAYVRQHRSYLPEDFISSLKYALNEDSDVHESIVDLAQRLLQLLSVSPSAPE
jgi:hypothetical protein